jgi:hypothetical protein
MSWAGIASNQCVSLDNLKDAVATGVFVQKNTIPTGSKQITKTEAEYYVNINTISGKTASQLVVKSNLVAVANYTVRLYAARTTSGIATLWYGINDVSCPSGGSSILTGGSLLFTLSLPYGTTLWIQTRNSSDQTIINCTQDTTGTYCSTYGTCTFSHYITGAIDISTKANAASTC